MLNGITSQQNELCMYSYEAELTKKETMLAALQSDLDSLSAKYCEQQKQMEDSIRSKCAAAECKIDSSQSVSFANWHSFVTWLNTW